MSVMQKTTAKQVALLSNGTYDTGKGQAFDDYLWDTLLVPAQAKKVQFFKTPIQSQYGTTSGDGKTEIETSMEDTGKLPAGQSFLVNAISISLISNTAVANNGVVDSTAFNIVNAWREVLTHSVWELKFTNTEYSWRDSGSIFLPSIFEQTFQQDAVNTSGSQSQIGQFQHYNWIKVPTKVPISELVSFSVNANFDAGENTIKTKLDDALTYLNAQKVEMRTQLKGMLIRKL